jgi:hypothetical protein
MKRLKIGPRPEEEAGLLAMNAQQKSGETYSNNRQPCPTVPDALPTKELESWVGSRYKRDAFTPLERFPS